MPFIQTIACHHHGPHGADSTGLVNGCDTGDDRSQHDEDQRQGREKCQYDITRKLSIILSRERDRRGDIAFDEGDNQNEQHVNRDQNQAWHHRPHEHVPGTGGSHTEFAGHGKFAGCGFVCGSTQCARLIHSVRQLVGQNDQNDRRRNYLTQRTRCGNCAGR